MENNEVKNTSFSFRKFFRRLLRVLTTFLAVFFGLLLTLAILLRFPAVQTWIAQKAAAYFTETYGIPVSIDRVDINLLHSIQFEGLMVGDHHGDTLLRAGHLEVIPGYVHFNTRKIVLDEVLLEDGYFRLHKYEGEKGMNIDYIINLFKSDKPKDTTSTGEPWGFGINDISLNRIAFNLIDDTAPKMPSDFQAGNIRALVETGRFSDFRVAADSIIFDIDRLKATDHSGAHIDQLECHFIICSTAMIFEGARLKTKNSDLDIDIRFLYTDWKDFGEFIDKVHFKTELRPGSRFNFKDVGYFTDALKGIDLNAGITGFVKGPLSDIHGRGIRINLGYGTEIRVDADLIGLPDINQTFMSYDIRQIKTNSRDLEALPVPPFGSGHKLLLPPEVKRLGDISFKGTFSGLLTDFDTYGTFETSIGKGFTDIHMSCRPDFTGFEYGGTVGTTDFQLGTLLNLPDLLGNTTVYTRIKGKEFDPALMHIEMDGSADAFTFKGYTYRNIQIKGILDKMEFDGRVKIQDDALHLAFDGSLNFSKKIPTYNFSAVLDGLDLTKTHLVPDDSIKVDHSVIRMNASGNSIDNIVGSISLDSTFYRRGNSEYELKKLTVVAEDFLSSRSFRLKSDYMDAEFTGTFKFVSLYNNVLEKIDRYFPSFGLRFDEKLAAEQQTIFFGLNLKDMDPVTSVFLPDLKIGKNTNLDGHYNSLTGLADVELKSPEIEYSGLVFRNPDISLNSDKTSFETKVNVPRFYVSDSLYFTDVKAGVSGIQDSVKAGLSWSGDQQKLTRGSFSMDSYLGDSTQMKIAFQPSYIAFQDSIWNLSSDAAVTWKNQKLYFQSVDLNARTGESISISGVGGDSPNDIMRLIINDFPVTYINQLMNSQSTKLGGLFSGYVGVFSLLKNPFIEADLLLAGLTVNKSPMGDVYFKSNYDNQNGLITLDAFIEYNGKKTFTVDNGRFYPLRKKDQFFVDILMEEQNIGLLETFTAPDFTNISGKARGKLSINGTVSNPDLNGEVYLDKATFRVPIMGVKYTLSNDESNPIKVTPNLISLGRMTLRDPLDNSAQLSGNIRHNYFNKIRMDLFMDTRNRNFMFLNSRVDDSESFYGTAIAKGNVAITGTPADIRIAVKASTAQGTRLYIPMTDGTSTAGDNSFVIFVDKKNVALGQSRSVRAKETSALTLEIDADITPDAEVQIIFDERTGDILKSFGKGSIRVILDPNRNLKMFGEYEVFKGDYMFNLQNVVNKKLDLQQGGLISWSGDPNKALIDAAAVYKIRTSPAALMTAFIEESGDSQSGSNFKAKIPVEVQVKLKGELLEPLISFDILFPSIDEKTRTQLASVLSNQDQKNQQAFALMVLNQFISPGNAAGNVGGNALGANSLEVISNQLSNFVSNFSDNLDFGVRYRSKGGTSSGSDEVEVAVSTRLLNDRLIVDGNFGMATNRNNSATGNANNSSGSIIDINVEFKVTNDGKLRIKGFNRSNDANIIRPFPYTQGMGVSYQTQFDNWKDLLYRRKKQSSVSDSLR